MKRGLAKCTKCERESGSWRASFQQPGRTAASVGREWVVSEVME